MKYKSYAEKGAQRAPSAKLLSRLRETIDPNLKEMAHIVEIINQEKKKQGEGEITESMFLLRAGSYLYEFYMEAEEAMVFVAKASGKWVPHTLDWHERILRHLRSFQEGLRPPVLSHQTANSLQKYMYFYLTFSRHSGSPSPEKVVEMVEDLGHTYYLFKRDLEAFCGVMEQLFE